MSVGDGAPKKEMMASPSYLSMVPPSRMMLLITVRYLFSSARSVASAPPKCREALHVGENGGRLLLLPSERQLLRIRQEVTDDVRRDVALEGAAHLALLLLRPKELDGGSTR